MGKRGRLQFGLGSLYSFPQADVSCSWVGGGGEEERGGTGLAPGTCASAPSSTRDLGKVVEAEPCGVILGPLRRRCW